MLWRRMALAVAGLVLGSIGIPARAATAEDPVIERLVSAYKVDCYRYIGQGQQKGDLVGSSVAEFVVVAGYEASCGGNDSFDTLFVFSADRRLLASKRIAGRSYRFLDSWNVTNRLVVLRGRVYGPDDGACCPTGSFTERLKMTQAASGKWSLTVQSTTSSVPRPTVPPTTQGPDGSRARPWPLGTVISVRTRYSGNWDIQVHSVEEYGTGRLGFADPPPGLTFVIVNYGVRFNGPEAKARSRSLMFSTVDSANVQYDTTFCSAPEPRFPSVDVFQNGTVGGNECFLAHPARLDSLLLYLDLGGGVLAFFATR